MGAWGCGPYDNDSAADWFYELKDIGLYDLIEHGLNSDSYYEQRAAAWLVQRLAVSVYVYDTDKYQEHIDLAVEKLNAILKDDEWISCWRDTDEIVAEIKQQIHEIENPNASPGLMEKMCSDLGGVEDTDKGMAEMLDEAMEEAGFIGYTPCGTDEDTDEVAEALDNIAKKVGLLRIKDTENIE